MSQYPSREVKILPFRNRHTRLCRRSISYNDTVPGYLYLPKAEIRALREKNLGEKSKYYNDQDNGVFKILSFDQRAPWFNKWIRLCQLLCSSPFFFFIYKIKSSSVDFLLAYKDIKVSLKEEGTRDFSSIDRKHGIEEFHRERERKGLTLSNGWKRFYNVAFTCNWF